MDSAAVAYAHDRLPVTEPVRTSRERLVAGIVVLNLAGACLLWTLRDHVMPHDFRQTNGVVLRTHVEDMSIPTGAVTSGGACLVVEYRYMVDGAGFVGQKYRSSGFCLGTGRATRERYAPGSPVAVWYEHGDPSFAVLDPRYEWDAAWIWGLFLILIAMGNAELFMRVRRATQPDTET